MDGRVERVEELGELVSAVGQGNENLLTLLWRNLECGIIMFV